MKMLKAFFMFPVYLTRGMWVIYLIYKATKKKNAVKVVPNDLELVQHINYKVLELTRRREQYRKAS